MTVLGTDTNIHKNKEEKTARIYQACSDVLRETTSSIFCNLPDLDFMISLNSLCPPPGPSS